MKGAFSPRYISPANTAVSSQGGGGGEQGGEEGKRESEKGRESCLPQALSTQCNLPPLSLRPSPSPLLRLQVLAKRVTSIAARSEKRRLCSQAN